MLLLTQYSFKMFNEFEKQSYKPNLKSIAKLVRASNSSLQGCRFDVYAEHYIMVSLEKILKLIY